MRLYTYLDAYDGGESIKRIVGMLKDRKTPTTHGRPSWSPALIRKILRNKDYLGVEPYPRMIEDEQFKRVQEHLKRSRDIWNQRHPTGSIQGTSMYTGRLICSSCGGVYSIYKQSSRCDNRNVRYWKCRHYDPATKEPCKMPVLTEKQLDGMFLQALMRMKTEPTLYQEETKKILTGIIKEKQRIESELNGDWNKCNEAYKRMEQLYFQIAAKRYQEIKLTDLTYQIEDYLRGLDSSIQVEEADLSVAINASVFKIIKRVEVQPDRSLKFELINNAIVLQYPEIKTKIENEKHTLLCPLRIHGWMDRKCQSAHEQYGPYHPDVIPILRERDVTDSTGKRVGEPVHTQPERKAGMEPQLYPQYCSPTLFIWGTRNFLLW